MLEALRKADSGAHVAQPAEWRSQLIAQPGVIEVVEHPLSRAVCALDEYEKKKRDRKEEESEPNLYESVVKVSKEHKRLGRDGAWRTPPVVIQMVEVMSIPCDASKTGELQGSEWGSFAYSPCT